MGLAARSREKVICVDDEPHIASGLSLHLRRRYDIEIATSGAAGLEVLARSPDAAVVISDMRMPGMSGAEFLAKACASHPLTTRILLTGYSELDAAVKAINLGNVYRFLVKPCAPPELVRTVDAAADLHRTLIAEKELLEKTVHGSIKMLTEVLAIANPMAFGRGSRLKELVSLMADKLGEKNRWQVEVAALLSPLPSITLPNETAEKLYYGAALSPAEQAMVARAPDVTEQLLGHIPRLEEVRAILRSYHAPFRPPVADASEEERSASRAAQLLKVAFEYDALEARGMTALEALAALNAHAQQYEPSVLSTLAEVCQGRAERETIREISLAALKIGMVFANDVRMTSGTLFVARGYEVTENFLERVRNFRPGSVKEPVKVVLKSQ
jgi:CheY-like chemotaxis protein